MARAVYEVVVIDGHEIRVYRQSRRSLVMKTTPLGLVMFIPRRASLRSDLVQGFIRDALHRLGDKAAPQNSPVITSPGMLRQMVREWAARMHVKPGRISIREMFRKWGSCSSKGNISLNTALCRVPRPLAEYVIVHELAHLTEFNHNKGFRALMDVYLPDWREREEALQAWMAGGRID
jgi:hypothetical protein